MGTQRVLSNVKRVNNVMIIIMSESTVRPINQFYFKSQLNGLKDTDHSVKRSLNAGLENLSIDSQQITDLTKVAGEDDRKFLEQMSDAFNQYADPVKFEEQVRTPINNLLGNLASKAMQFKSAIDKGLAA